MPAWILAPHPTQPPSSIRLHAPTHKHRHDYHCHSSAHGPPCCLLHPVHPMQTQTPAHPRHPLGGRAHAWQPVLTRTPTNCTQPTTHHTTFHQLCVVATMRNHTLVPSMHPYHARVHPPPICPPDKTVPTHLPNPQALRIKPMQRLPHPSNPGTYTQCFCFGSGDYVNFMLKSR